MFTINFYECYSPANAVDKELGIVDSPQGYLRKDSSVVDPVIVVQTDSNPVWVRGANYAYIEDFGRYYYITNVISKSGAVSGGDVPLNQAHLWEVHMHVDVLMSYKEEIRKQTAVVSRQESNYNLMLDDGIFMAYQNPILQTKLFSAASPFETQEFVLIVAGS